jgi:hypothetical protein
LILKIKPNSPSAEEALGLALGAVGEVTPPWGEAGLEEAAGGGGEAAMKPWGPIGWVKGGGGPILPKPHCLPKPPRGPIPGPPRGPIPQCGPGPISPIPNGPIPIIPWGPIPSKCGCLKYGPKRLAFMAARKWCFPPCAQGPVTEKWNNASFSVLFCQ